MSGTTRSCNTDTVSSSLSLARSLSPARSSSASSLRHLPLSALQSRQSAAFLVDPFTASVPCAPCDSLVFFRFRNVCILSPGRPDFVTSVDPYSSSSSSIFFRPPWCAQRCSLPLTLLLVLGISYFREVGEDCVHASSRGERSSFFRDRRVLVCVGSGGFWRFSLWEDDDNDHEEEEEKLAIRRADAAALRISFWLVSNNFALRFRFRMCDDACGFCNSNTFYSGEGNSSQNLPSSARGPWASSPYALDLARKTSFLLDLLLYFFLSPLVLFLNGNTLRLLQFVFTFLLAL